MYKTIPELVSFIQSIYGTERIPLHSLTIFEDENKYIQKAFDEGNIATSGTLIDKVEQQVCRLATVDRAFATNSGTSALHLALHAMGCDRNCEVLCPAFTFVATVNAILYTGAQPVFLDSSSQNPGLSSKALEIFIDKNCEFVNGQLVNRRTKKRVFACVPVHVFGIPCEIEEIVNLCKEYQIYVVEDAAHAFSSSLKNRWLGTYGDVGVFSFNGSKIVTSGSGGMIVTNNKTLHRRIAHLGTTAKTKVDFTELHDEMGFNYRMSNLNAALLLGQIEHLNQIRKRKNDLAAYYVSKLKSLGLDFVHTTGEVNSNSWLNHVIFKSEQDRDLFVELANANGVDARKAWTLMTDLRFCKNFQKGELTKAKFFQERIALLPSGVGSI